MNMNAEDAERDTENAEERRHGNGKAEDVGSGEKRMRGK